MRKRPGCYGTQGDRPSAGSTPRLPIWKNSGPRSSGVSAGYDEGSCRAPEDSKNLLVGSTCFAAISMALDSILETTYVYYPRAPEQASGLVVPHEVKGITVYITEQQSQVT